MIKIAIICALFIVFDAQCHVLHKRDTPNDSSANQPNILESFQRNLMNFKTCLDQSFASAASEVNVKHLQPVFNAVGDSVNRVSKAFDDLTAPAKTAKRRYDDDFE